MRRTQLFEELEAEDDEALKQHDDEVNEAHVGGSGSFALAPNNDEAGPSDAGVDLTFDDYEE